MEHTVLAQSVSLVATASARVVIQLRLLKVINHMFSLIFSLSPFYLSEPRQNGYVQNVGMMLILSDQAVHSS